MTVQITGCYEVREIVVTLHAVVGCRCYLAERGPRITRTRPSVWARRWGVKIWPAEQQIQEQPKSATQETVSMDDMERQWNYSLAQKFDSTYNVAHKEDADLQKFFARPVRILTVPWGVNTGISQTFDPWSLFFSQSRVVNRINNYNLLRAKLCVRFLINGNGFYWGRAMAYYTPLPFEDGETRPWTAPLANPSTINASQKMHVYLDPTKSQGADMCLPFVWYKNALHIPTSEWDQMGRMSLNSLTTLRNLNDPSGDVTITVLAWAEDVQLSIPTLVDASTISPQADLVMPQADEYAGSGVISGPAAAVEKAAGKLEAIPYIGRYARATEIAASAVGTIAKFFGMSRPVDNSGIAGYKPYFVGNMPNTNVTDTSNKLTLDVKQELTIDPIANGILAGDEMAIKNIAMRESYLTIFDWSTTDSVDSTLFSCRATPQLFDNIGREFHITPMMHAVQPFNAWRGSIKFRFQIVANAFMKGRLRVTFDPNGGRSTDYNIQYSHIVDLADSRDFTIVCGWPAASSFLETRVPTTNELPFAVGATITPDPINSTGVLTISPITQLTSTDGIGVASVIVSVSACDDFEVANPDGSNTQLFTIYEPQSPALLNAESKYDGVSPQAMSQADADATTMETAPVGAANIATLGPTLDVDNTYDVYYGDPVPSIRTLLKRYDMWGSTAHENGTNGAVYRIFFAVLPNFPFYRGYAPDGINQSSVPNPNTPYNYCKMTHLNWFTPAYLCRRGGVRWKYAVAPTRHNYVNGLFTATRSGKANDFQIGGYAIDVDNQPPINPNEWITGFNRYVSDTPIAGTVCTPARNNPVLEIELPFHTISRFEPARRPTTQEPDIFQQSHEYRLGVPGNEVAMVTSVIHYVAAAEDFSLSFYQGPLTLYLEGDPPV